ncbi:MAG: hypothetical protein K1X75_07790 [Leptospirales bacterium]|nr:hypothetical protein [Leptospirales bacterium]
MSKGRGRWLAVLLSVLSLAAIFSGVRCTLRTSPNAEECRKGLRNFLRLQTGGALSEAQLDQLLNQGESPAMAEQVCIKKKSRLQVECEIEAKSIEELRLCRRLAPPPNSGSASEAPHTP